MMSKLLCYMKKLFVILLKTLYLGSFLVFSVWLLKMLYFPSGLDGGDVVTTEYSRNEEMIERILKGKETVPREHFHITDKNIFRLESEPSFCLKCHGIYPHTKDAKKLSFLNLHTGFMACEVCHVRRGFEEGDHYFAWADLGTGEKSMKAEGGFGKYNAMIVPIKKAGWRHERLDREVNEKFEDFFSSLKEKRYQAEHREELMRIHENNLSKKAVICLDCHKKDGYLDFAALGFNRGRINQLISSEVSRMVEKYETFYIPKMLIFE